MRALMLGLLLLTGCRTAELPTPDGDGGNPAASDLAQVGSFDLRGAQCVSACNRCTSGVCCGQSCCGAGEWCDEATSTCHCGQGPACTDGNHCASGGPIAPGQTCGAICCGTPQNGCPL
jgi:hypothetical protein